MISIIVPVYNSERYLQKCIDSIRNQTLKDFECILIDDGSRDSSPQICDSASEKDCRFKTFHIVNGGVSRARNYGIAHSSENSSFIGFVDSDDWIEPDMFEILLRNAQDSGADISICGLFGGSNRKIKSVLSKTEAMKNLFGTDGFLGYSCNKLVKTEFLRNNLFNEKIGCYEDLELFYRVLQKCNTVIWDNTPLYHYIDSPDSLTRTYGLTVAKDKGLSYLWSVSKNETNYEIRRTMQNHVYIMYMEICIEYIVHSDVSETGFSKCRAFVKENKRVLPWIRLPFKKKIWRIIILNSFLTRITARLRHNA